MKIDINSALTIVLGLIAIIGAIYRLAQIESSIINKINILEKKLDVHLAEYDGKSELIEYRLKSQEELIAHKFNRCWNQIKDIESYLAKNGFIPHERLNR
jgi:ADP-glucose pyrophosphorylase